MRGIGSTGRALLRIVGIVFQGALYAVLRSVVGIAVIPLLFLADFWTLCNEGHRGRSRWTASLMIVPWVALALLDAVAVPFVMLWRGTVDIVRVAAAEWRRRGTSEGGGEAPAHDYLADVLEDYVGSPADG